MSAEDVKHLIDPESGQPISFLRPGWPAPAGVNAVTTLRHGGVSQPPYDGLNLADHVGDDPEHVRCNRQILIRTLKLPSAPFWLSQVHGTTVVELRDANFTYLSTKLPAADAACTDRHGRVCAVLTADCLPVLFCDRSGHRVAAAHAGWRGLAAGILEATVKALACPAAELLVWLGPAIGSDAFEVGAEVREVFVEQDALAGTAFRASENKQGEKHYLADIYALARMRLQHLGVQSIYGGHWCTVTQPDFFYSYRRDGDCGRMASLIWLT